MKYKVQVLNPSGSATILCEIKPFPNASKNLVEIIYHQVVSSFNNEEMLLAITNCQFNTAEELRIMTVVHEIVSLDEINEKSWIEKHLKEIYGAESNLNFEEINN